MDLSALSGIISISGNDKGHDDAATISTSCTWGSLPTPSSTAGRSSTSYVRGLSGTSRVVQLNMENSEATMEKEKILRQKESSHEPLKYMSRSNQSSLWKRTRGSCRQLGCTKQRRALPATKSGRSTDSAWSMRPLGSHGVPFCAVSTRTRRSSSSDAGTCERVATEAATVLTTRWLP
ncbi:unnamed protein product [Amoebophrya sp. A25]|nr:unnamed protein product [Amoebophrya sp. A25]|eukprot:GSA25T00015599001.1